MTVNFVRRDFYSAVSRVVRNGLYIDIYKEVQGKEEYIASIPAGDVINVIGNDNKDIDIATIE
jgi:hypothetical protein